jgi:hypothetical protein
LKDIVVAPIQISELHGRRDQLRRPHDIPLPAKVLINFADSGGRSVGVVRFRTKPQGIRVSK